MRSLNPAVHSAVFGVIMVLALGAPNSLPGTEPEGASTSVATPHLGEPFQITDEIVYGPSSRAQSQPAVASDGTDFLVAWADRYQSYYRIMRGSRVTAQGAVLDTVTISFGFGWDHPAVAFGGDQYLVAWETGDEYNLDIRGARVTSSGHTLDSVPISITSAGGHQVLPAASCDGENFLVAWSDKRRSRGYEIYCARVSPSGEMLDPGGIGVTWEPYDQIDPAVAFDGTNFIVVWSDGRSGSDFDLYASRVTSSGEVLDRDGFPVSTRGGNQQLPSVASDGSSSLVAWKDDQASAGDVYCARILSTGEVVDPDGIAVAASGANHHSPHVTYDGTNYAITWTKLTGYRGLRCARVSPLGEVIDPGGWVIADEGIIWAMGSAGENLLLAEVQGALDQGSSIYGVLTTSSALERAPEPFVISRGMNQQIRPCAARNGTHFAVAWMDGRRGRRDIYMNRIGFSGYPLDPAPVPLVTDGNVEPFPMDAAGANRGSLFTWIDSRDGRSKIYGARMSFTGEVLDRDGFCLCDSSAAADPGIATDGSDYLAVWTDARGGGDSLRVYGARVGSEGEQLDPAGILISPGRYSKDPAAAFGAENYMVAWIEPEDPKSVYGLRIVGARVSRSGVVLDGDGIVLSEKGDRLAAPTVAFDGSNWLVAWARFIPAYREIGASGVLIDRSGAVLSSFNIKDSLDFYSPGEVSAVFDGEYFIVSWPSSAGEPTCRASRVSRSGEVIDAKPIVVSGDDRVRNEASMATLYPGRTLIVYPRLTGVPNWDCYRIWGTFLYADVPEPSFRLAASPNPFRAALMFHYYLSAGEHVRLSVFDAMGRLVKTVAEGYREPGPRQEYWDGTNDNGRAAPSGIYFGRIRTEHAEGRTRCILVR